jgi:hypothetical protein
MVAINQIAETSMPAPAAGMQSFLEGISEGKVNGVVVLSPRIGKPRRRMIYLDSYGGAAMWEKIKKGLVPPHHLRGCLELVRLGYEVALAEPLPDFWQFKRRPIPHDLRLLKMAASWLGRDGIIYCGHNVLVWMPFLKALGAIRCKIVSNIFGCEDLPLARAHSGIISLTPIGAERARQLAPKVKVANLGWGADLSVFPTLPYQPDALFSCGITLRDHATLSAAASQCTCPIQIVLPGTDGGLVWPSNVTVIDGGKGWNVEDKKLSYQDLLHKHYGRSAGSLLILKNHPWVEETAAGFTELIEVMAMARPIIVTKTKTISREVDVEKEGWGIFVSAGEPGAIAEAMKYLADNPMKAEEMGKAGRRLAEGRFNIKRFAEDLHAFFESL